MRKERRGDCFAILVVSFSVIMSVEAYRIRFFKFVTEVWEDLTSVTIFMDSTSDIGEIKWVQSSYVPEGYTVSEENYHALSLEVVYVNEQGRKIYYMQEALTASQYIFDTEGIEVNTIEIVGQNVATFVNKGTAQVIWYDDQCIYSFMSKCDPKELLKMAESILQKNEKEVSQNPPSIR